MTMKKYAPILLAMLLWVWPSIFIKYLSDSFSSYTQNFYRFSSAAVFLLLLGFFRSRAGLFSSLRNIRVYVPAAVFVLLAQVTWVEGIMLTEPAFASFLRRSSILFVIILSFYLFQSERNIISSKHFIRGSLLSLAGVTGVILGGPGDRILEFNYGIFLILLSSLFWALFIVAVRKMARGTDSLVSTGIIFLLTLPAFFIGGMARGDIGEIFNTGAFVNLVLFSSGILFVGIANTLQYKSIKNVGSSLTANLLLLTPFLTAVASYYVFGEVLTPFQLFSGMALVLGCVLLLRVG